MTPLYVCVHVPEFAAQALIRLRPELMGKAVAVMAGVPPLEEVCSASPAAMKQGVAHGMTKAELESFHDIVVLRRSLLEEQHAKAALLDAVSAFTPRVEIQPARNAALDAVLDMTGSELIFGSAKQIVAKLDAVLKKFFFSAGIAASANQHTAVCLAPSSRKPSVVAPGEEAVVLHHLPLTALPLSQEQADKLELWGLKTLGDLAQLPETELVVRLGQQGKRLQLMAQGKHPHLMVPEEPEFTLSEYIAFDAPIELLDSLLFVLGPMLDQLIARAQNHALALASVTLTLALDGGERFERTLKPALPVAQREVLLKLLHLDLQAHPPPAGILAVLVKAEPGDRSKMQLGLFAPQTPEAARLDITLARIAAIVGEDRVGRARLLDTHASEGFVMEPFTVSTASSVKTQETKSNTTTLRRCRPPSPLTMMLRESRPHEFYLTGKRYIVHQAFGPWRRSGEWWTQEVWSCEEWDISACATSGETLLCILAHDLLHHHWQMEAMYD